MSPIFALGLLAAVQMFLPPAALPERSALPGALEMSDGSPVTSKDGWFSRRAPELRALFEHYEYGQRPADTPVHATVVVTEPGALEGQALLRVARVDCGLDKPVSLLVVTPPHRAKAPCFLCLIGGAICTVLSDPAIPPPDAAPGARLPERGSGEASWSVAATIARGYAVAFFCVGDIVPDRSADAERALQRWHPGAAERAGGDTGTLMAWAWGASRMLDYLQTVPEIDPKRVAVMGHSRDGKAALVAGAFDPRFALILPSQSGCGGAAPCRLPTAPPSVAQTVADINRSFPWWFAVNFRAFGEQVDRLPFDQHELIALCAPRPVLLSCAVDDKGSNPEGQFEMLQAANPVYRLVTGEGVDAKEMPAVGKLLPSRLGYFIRPGKHSVTAEDWSAWLDYADKWLAAGAAE